MTILSGYDSLPTKRRVTVFPDLPAERDIANAFATAYGVLWAKADPAVQAEADAYMARCRSAARFHEDVRRAAQ